MKKHKTRLTLDNAIAKLVVKYWPEFKSQQFMADKLNVSQAQISRTLKTWDKHYPIKIEEPEARDHTLEEKLRKLYNLKKIIVLKNKDVHLATYQRQVGMHAADLLASIIPEIVDRRESDLDIDGTAGIENVEKPCLRIAGSDGNNVLLCITCLINDLINTDIQIEVMPTIALRSKRLVELSPAHSMAQLLDLKPNVTVTNLYQLPEIEIDNYDQMDHVVKQGIITADRLKFNSNICKNDIVVLSVENVKRYLFGKGFPQFVEDMGMSDIIRKLDIRGELSFSPFNTRHGFLFHYLKTKVFAIKNQDSVKDGSYEDLEFTYSLDEQVDLLRKIAVVGKAIEAKDLFSVARLYCSIFTLDISILEQYGAQGYSQPKPFILIVAEGTSQKAEPLHYILNRFKNKESNAIDGLVTSRLVAEKVIELSKKTTPR
ncbi:MAG: hypothetical protein ACUZ8E_05520 [Candidatus Anammoxibacter sp.]